MSKFKITKTIDQVQTIITNLRTLYASQRKYEKALPASAAYNMGVLTDEIYDGSKGLNPYGGTIEFGIANSNRNWTIKYTQLTSEACLKPVTADWGADASSGLVSIGAGGKGSVTTTYTWTGTDKLPPELISATTACAGDSTGANTAVEEWTFR